MNFVELQTIENRMVCGGRKSGVVLWRMAGAILICLVLTVTAAVAQERQAKKSATEKSSAPAARTAVEKLTSDQEDVALSFAREHHPELAVLLDRLRATSPAGFSRGIREVHSTVQRLERYRDRQPARFAAELRSWKTDSEIRLLTAKWVMTKDPELETQIRELLRERQLARLERLEAERKRLKERLSQLDEQIAAGNTKIQEDVSQEWERLARQATIAARAQSKSIKKKTSKTKQDRP